jgi:Zn2+/Cd2+-exporting ATPase
MSKQPNDQIRRIEKLASEKPGIVQLELDSENEAVRLDYDGRQLTPNQVAELADQLTPTLRQQMETCTWQMGRQGGRACETCALSIEKQLGKIEGVHDVSASCHAGVLSVTFDNAQLSADDLLHYVQRLGVSVSPSLARGETTPSERPRGLWRQLWGWVEDRRERLELIFTIVTFVTMFSGLIAERFELTAVALISYTLAYLAGGVFGVQAGLESLRLRAIDVDLLMVLAAIGAALVGAPFEGALLLFLFSLSNVLQSYALDRTRNAIQALMKLRPDTALVRRGEAQISLPIEQIEVGEELIIRPGDRIALDSLISEGESSVDQSSLTGESMPVSRRVGDNLFAGSINLQGGLLARVTRPANDSTLARLIKMVEEAQSDKAKTQRFIDTAEQYYAMGVIGFTILAIIVPVLFGSEPFAATFYRAMTLMVAASPCALVISTPATVLSAIANGARKGVLFKGGVYVEEAATIKVIAFDKTGTLTQGKPKLTDVISLDDSDPSGEQMLALAASVEARSEHPLAQAVVTAAKEKGLTFAEAQEFQSASGRGVWGKVDEQTVTIGSLRFWPDEKPAGWEAAVTEIEKLQHAGKTAVVVAVTDENGAARIIGALGIADVLRANAAAVMRRLRELGVTRTVMLTGDNQQVAEAIAAEVGVDEFYADLLPEDKLRILHELADKYGPVAMIGDGVNDAPALAAATIGIAMGAAGTDVALETADIVLMADDLSNIPYVIALSRQTRRTLTHNLIFAIAVIIVLVTGVLGFQMALPLSVIGHEGSTVLVSLNGLRLLAFRKSSLDSEQ